MSPAPTTSTSSVSFTPPTLARDPRGSGPGRLGDDGGAGGPALGPEDLELALLPLAHHAGGGDVLALGELDGAGDGLELRRIQHGLDLRAVEADLADALLEDLQRRVGEGAGPAVGLFLVLLHVGIVVLPGARELDLRVPACDAHDALGALEALPVERERGADPGEKHGRIPVHFLGL